MGEIPPYARFRIVELSPIGLLATGDAWGEWGAEDFMSATGLNDVPQYIARGFSWDALLPYYSLQGLPDVVGYILSAVIGVAVMVIVFRLLALAVRWCWTSRPTDWTSATPTWSSMCCVRSSEPERPCCSPLTTTTSLSGSSPASSTYTPPTKRGTRWHSLCATALRACS